MNVTGIISVFLVALVGQQRLALIFLIGTIRAGGRTNEQECSNILQRLLRNIAFVFVCSDDNRSGTAKEALDNCILSGPYHADLRSGVVTDCILKHADSVSNSNGGCDCASQGSSSAGSATICLAAPKFWETLCCRTRRFSVTSFSKGLLDSEDSEDGPGDMVLD